MLLGLTAMVVLATETTSVEAPDPAAPTEVVRIKRDFGKPHFDLAIDAWQAGPSRLEKVQLLWVNTSEDDRRKPLGRMIERMVDLKYKRLSERSFKVVVAGDDKEFTFTVELAQDGGMATYVAVDTEGGQHVARCKTDSARLMARRVLGIPVGISKVEVKCRDAGGTAHAGMIRHKPV